MIVGGGYCGRKGVLDTVRLYVVEYVEALRYAVRHPALVIIVRDFTYATYSCIPSQSLHSTG